MEYKVGNKTWTPTTKQSEFLGCPSFEVLYGGTAGSGKTSALLWDVCGINQPNVPAINRPSYLAVMIRPTMPELREIINVTQSMYPAIDPGAVYKAGEHTWFFSSGARIIFTYLKEDLDVHRFKSMEIHYVGWEELTLHPTDYGYTYLLTRMRKGSGQDDLSDLNMYVRSTTNPDGPGHSWVKKRWNIPDDGASTYLESPIAMGQDANGKAKTAWVTRQFISAKLSDNPHVDDDYEAKIRMSGATNVNYLLEGNWNSPRIEGAFYADECAEVELEGRRKELPWRRDVPTHFYWDLGVADYTSFWAMQENGPWKDFIYFYQAHGKPLNHYIKHIQDLKLIQGTHYLPHDANHRRMMDVGVKTMADIFRQHGVINLRIVPRIPQISTGIQLVRDMFPSCRFDKEKTAAGWECLLKYQIDKNARTQAFNATPRHDEYSHGADAFRMCAQAIRSEPVAFGQTRGRKRTSIKTEERSNIWLTNGRLP